jgi:hypothetical protein
MRTNGFKIKHSNIHDTYLDINDDNIELVVDGPSFAKYGIKIDKPNQLMLLQSINAAGTAGAIELDSKYVEIGPTPSRSELRVQNIYNQAGTSAPFFPAGVQYQDNTIQRTAWRGYDQGLI